MSAQDQNVSDFNTFSFLLFSAMFCRFSLFWHLFETQSSDWEKENTELIELWEREAKPNAFSPPYILVFHVWIAKYIWILRNIIGLEGISQLFGVPDALC